jgi:cytoskeletal protein RodZ
MTIRRQQQSDAPSHPQPHHGRRPTRTLLLIVVLLILVGAGGIAWWLFSPLFFHNTSNDVSPFAYSPSAVSTPASVNTSSTVLRQSRQVQPYWQPTSLSTKSTRAWVLPMITALAM